MLPDIFKNKEITISSDDAFVLNLISQSQQTSQLVKMRKLEESKVPTGTKILRRDVTDQTQTISLTPPWISFSLINDGIGSVIVWINDDEEPLLDIAGAVDMDETMNLDMGFPIIDFLYLKTTPGATASVRIYGKQGRNIKI